MRTTNTVARMNLSSRMLRFSLCLGPCLWLVHFLCFQDFDLNDIAELQGGISAIPTQMNVLVWILAASEPANMIIEICASLIGPLRNRLLSKPSARGDMRTQDGQIVCSCNAETLAVDANFESDHHEQSNGSRAHVSSDEQLFGLARNRALALNREVPEWI